MHANNSNSQISWFQPPLTNQQPLLLPLFVDPFAIQQLLGPQANNMPYNSTPMPHAYGSPLYADPVYLYQRMAQQHQRQYRALSSAPSRNQHAKGRHKAEARYPNHLTHESSCTIASDRSTGTHPVYSQMNASNNPGVGGARRPPTGNASMVDSNRRQRTRISPYDRSGFSRTRRIRTDQVHPSVYEIPRRSGRMLISTIHPLSLTTLLEQAQRQVVQTSPL
jgi:hypothetical protein